GKEQGTWTSTCRGGPPSPRASRGMSRRTRGALATRTWHGSRLASLWHREPHLPLTDLANADGRFFITIGFEEVNPGGLPLAQRLVAFAVRYFMVLLLQALGLEKALPIQPSQFRST